jgi:hypothetical protein
MAHVVLHCAEYPTSEAAELAGAGLQRLKDEYIAYERSVGHRREPDGVVAPPLVAFGQRHGFAWPASGRFEIEGGADEIEVSVVDRLVFFHVGGFELGGEAIETYFARSGAIRCASERAHLVMRSAEPVASARELAAFLGDEDYEEQFTLLVDGAVELRPFHDEQIDFLYTVTLADAEHACVLGFDDSGVQDWAFVAMLYQLCGMDPSLDPAHLSTRTYG